MAAIIISAFPACGKTYYFNRNSVYSKNDIYAGDQRILDSDSSLFSWIYDENGNKTDVRNPEFPDNYIKYIKEHMKTEQIILVSSHKSVREALEKEGLEYYLVYPSKDMKRKWMYRFKKRGNTEEFIKFQDEHWDEFIDDMESETFPKKIVLDNHVFGYDNLTAAIYDILDYCDSGEE